MTADGSDWLKDDSVRKDVGLRRFYLSADCSMGWMNVSYIDAYSPVCTFMLHAGKILHLMHYKTNVLSLFTAAAFVSPLWSFQRHQVKVNVS